MSSLCKNALLASFGAIVATLAGGMKTILLLLGALTGIWILFVLEHYGWLRDDER